MKRELVVPWSIAPMYCVISGRSLDRNRPRANSPDCDFHPRSGLAKDCRIIWSSHYLRKAGRGARKKAHLSRIEVWKEKGDGRLSPVNSKSFSVEYSVGPQEDPKVSSEDNILRKTWGSRCSAVEFAYRKRYAARSPKQT